MLLTWIWFLICMAMNMCNETVSAYKCHIAYITVIRSLYSVGADMITQIDLDREPLVTVLTLEWFLPCVCSDVQIKVCLLCERHVT